MKKFYVLLVMLVSSFSAFSQVTEGEMKYIQKLWGKEKKEILQAVMQLNETEAAKFWPIYEAYSTSRQSLGLERTKLTENYASNYGKIADEELDQMTKAALKNDKSINKLYSKYYGKVKKAVGPMRAAQFLQLENYLDGKVRLAIQDQLPLLIQLNSK
jgi:hypothetical protein